MKSKLLVSLACAALSLPAMATVTLNTQFGILRDASSATVGANTLWILVVDTNGSGTFGSSTMGTNSTLTQGQASSLFSVGQTLALGGDLGGDTIFAIGGTNNGAGVGTESGELAGLSLGTNGLANGRAFAYFWFPGSTFGATNTVGTQVGGVHAPTDEPGGLVGMFIPPDSNSIFTGAASNDPAIGGSLTPAQLTAVIIPEPSTALLGLLGIAGLVRRRR